MSEVSKEIKIAEKLKFWEEQDQINKELIPRVVKSHEMITDLAAQFDKNLISMSLFQENIDENDEEISSLHEKLKSESSKRMEQISKLTAKVEEQDIHISEMKSMLMNQEEEIREVKKVLEKVNKNLGVTGNNNRNLAVNIGVLIAMILSIIAIIL
ncbi:hypothetical protein COD90_04470 [Bacillus cereus]|uniref:Uncharacterized protein n=1 Tax=Bacillus paramobilis TaxID=2817477 RepID=A0ABZ2VUD1_9BACI|nr:hypothetical protein [Bacillus sp. DE0042]PGW20179.1 hypothetical protein COD90_04470 [Bacillus cereus]RFB15808.1 hypothetical protein DZB88_02070 [Bacillus sp. OE]